MSMNSPPSMEFSSIDDVLKATFALQHIFYSITSSARASSARAARTHPRARAWSSFFRLSVVSTKGVPKSQHADALASGGMTKLSHEFEFPWRFSGDIQWAVRKSVLRGHHRGSMSAT